MWNEENDAIMRILVTDGMDKTALEQLRANGHEVVEQFYAPEELGAALRDADAVVVRSATKVRASHIDEAKGGRLKLIIRGGVGVDNIDVKYAEENGITVRNTPMASSNSVAELALGHMFSCARFLSVAGHTMREGKWEKKAYGKGFELGGKTLGIIGFGRIGQALGRVKLISRENIAKMKDGVVIINTSRGDNVDERDLLEALNAGKVRAAGLDVYTEEPSANAALYSHPNVSCTPHIGAATKEAQQRIGTEIVEIIQGFGK